MRMPAFFMLVVVCFTVRAFAEDPRIRAEVCRIIDEAIVREEMFALREGEVPANHYVTLTIFLPTWIAADLIKRHEFEQVFYEEIQTGNVVGPNFARLELQLLPRNL